MLPRHSVGEPIMETSSYATYQGTAFPVISWPKRLESMCMSWSPLKKEKKCKMVHWAFLHNSYIYGKKIHTESQIFIWQFVSQTSLLHVLNKSGRTFKYSLKFCVWSTTTSSVLISWILSILIPVKCEHLYICGKLGYVNIVIQVENLLICFLVYLQCN